MICLQRRALTWTGELAAVVLIVTSAITYCPTAYGMPALPSIQDNRTTSGVLTPGDPVRRDGQRGVDFLMTILRPGTRQLELIGSDMGAMDPHMCIFYGADLVAYDDDSGDGLNSRITGYFPQGEYVVRVGCRMQRNVQRQASFTITMSSVPTTPPPTSTTIHPTTMLPRHVASLRPGKRLIAAYGAGLPIDRGGRTFYDVRVCAQRDGNVGFEVVTTGPRDFIPILLLLDGQREIARDARSSRRNLPWIRRFMTASQCLTARIIRTGAGRVDRPVPFLFMATPLN